MNEKWSFIWGIPKYFFCRMVSNSNPDIEYRRTDQPIRIIQEFENKQHFIMDINGISDTTRLICTIITDPETAGTIDPQWSTEVLININL